MSPAGLTRAAGLIRPHRDFRPVPGAPPARPPARRSESPARLLASPARQLASLPAVSGPPSARSLALLVPGARPRPPLARQSEPSSAPFYCTPPARPAKPPEAVPPGVIATIRRDAAEPLSVLSLARVSLGCVDISPSFPRKRESRGRRPGLRRSRSEESGAGTGIPGHRPAYFHSHDEGGGVLPSSSNVNTT